ncbi:MAG: iron ABC transporter permease [Tissierellia bacterium]|nr:iron ABC transporter permease [Tissierellia bacterium]
MNRNISYSSLLEKAIIILLIIAFLLFILYPIAGLFVRSLTEGGQWSLFYYKDLFKEENIELIRNSVFVASLSSICATILALCIGLYAHFKGGRIRDLIYRGLMISMISPPFISSIGLLTLFGRRGLISYGLLGLTLNPYGWHGIVLLQSLGGIPLSAMFMMAGLNQIDSRLILASRDLGANPWQTLKNVILPSLIPTILSVLFLRFTMNISDFTTPVIIGGRFNVLATEAYLRVYAQANLNGAAAMTVLLLPPALVAFYFYNNNLQKTNTLSDRSKVLDVETLNYKLPRLVNFISGTITLVFFIIMVVQYGNIFIQAISRNVSGKLVFTTDHLHFFQDRHLDALLRTIHMALIAALLSTLFGVMLSYYNRMRRIPGMKSIEFIGSLPYIIPGIFFGLAYIVVFHNGPIKMTGTLIILIVNCTFRHVSVGNKAANATFENIDKKLEWASYDLGASKLQSLVTLIFPMLRPTFLTSFINAFTACMTTVGPLMLLVSPKNLIISVLMFSEVSNGRYGQAAVMGLSLILITFTVNLIAMALMTREKRITR